MSNGTQSWTCERCGKPCERQAVRGQRPKWCSDKCGWAVRSSKVGTCAQCGVEYQGYGDRFCSVHCSSQATIKPKPVKVAVEPPDLRSLIRRAHEAGDHAGVLAEIMSRTKRTPDGCLEWQGRVRKGYPLVHIGGRWHQVHRLVIESSMGASLGSQHAHHICANTRCVNPDHLQPVTHRDNIAEMMARQTYVARIRELEDALAQMAPSHPLLLLLPTA